MGNVSTLFSLHLILISLTDESQNSRGLKDEICTKACSYYNGREYLLSYDSYRKIININSFSQNKKIISYIKNVTKRKMNEQYPSMILRKLSQRTQFITPLFSKLNFLLQTFRKHSTNPPRMLFDLGICTTNS